MSFIDTRRHQLCGQIAGLPLYHPQETITGEFNATDRNLVLGGGSGEFAAAVVNVPAAVAAFIDEFADRFSVLSELVDGDPIRDYTGVLEYAEQHGLTYELLTTAADALDRDTAAADIVATSEWGGDDWSYVTRNARRGPGTPYRARKHHRIELWLACSIGEYVLVSFRDLIDHLDLPADCKRTLDSVAELVSHSPLYANVWQLPTGYRTGGRGEHLNDANMRH